MSSLTLLCDVVLMLHESFGTTMPLANRRQCTDSMNPQSEAFNSQIHTERSHILTITKNQANIYPGLHSTLRPIYPQLPLCPISFADGPAAMPQLYIRSATSYVVPRGISTLEASKPFGRAFNWVMCKACVCVCVCPPLDKGFPSTTPTRQGAHGSVPGVSQRSSRFRLGYRKRTLFRRTCNLNF